MSTLTSEMTFHRASSPERKNFLHLRLVTAARVDLARVFSYDDVKNRTFANAKRQECDMWQRRRKGKNTYIGVIEKKNKSERVTLTAIICGASKGAGIQSYLVCRPVLSLPQASFKTHRPGRKIMQPGSEELKLRGRVPLVAARRGVLAGFQRGWSQARGHKASSGSPDL